MPTFRMNPTSSFPYKILVADSHSLHRQALVASLSQEGYEVKEASSDENAWQVAQEFLPHLVLTSLNASSTTGLELVLKIRKHPFLRKSYVFVLSNQPEEEAEARAFDSGADEFLFLPVRFMPLLSRIRALQKKYGLGT